MGDRAGVARLYSYISGSRPLGNGLYTVPCSNIPTVSFTIGGVIYNISPTLFNQGPVSQGSTQCIGGIAASNTGYWTLGDVFLRGFYSVFDLGTTGNGNRRVGFATLS